MGNLQGCSASGSCDILILKAISEGSFLIGESHEDRLRSVRLPPGIAGQVQKYLACPAGEYLRSTPYKRSSLLHYLLKV